MPPTNIQTIKDDIDGRFVEVSWDDTDANVVRYRFFWVDSTGTAVESPFTYNLADRVAVVPGDIVLRIQNVLDWGGQFPGPDYTVPTAVAPTAPPAPETERQKLEDVVGPLEDGSKIAVYPAPSTVLTVNADGTVS